MKTSGAGSEGFFIFVPIVVMVGAAVLLAGGPVELVDYIDKTLVHAASVVAGWVRSNT
ncbi:MAG TPA: hypothetical protein VJM31_02615 [Vicinamibacterales bacterium]|nr:hypothetical protein [Vicinamibacterales bacterium]